MERPQLSSSPQRIKLISLVFCAAFWGALLTSTQAQTAQFTQGQSGTNTNTLQVPLGNYPGRGISLPINLNYSSKVWRLGFIKSIYYNYGGSNAVAEAIYSEYATAGWTTSLDVPIVEWPKQNDLYWYTGKPYASGSHYPYTFRVARVFVHMPDGSTHELRRADQVYQDTGSIDATGTFYAVDGSRMRYDANGAAPTLFLADGTRYKFNTNGTTQYVDRNGNTLTYTAATRQWRDTLDRAINMPWPANPQPISQGYPYSIPGVNGGTINYTLKFKNLSQALTAGSPALKPVGDYYLPDPTQSPSDYNSNNFTQVTQGASMFVSGMSDPDGIDYQTNTRVIGRGQVGSNVFDPVVLAEIILPTGQSYKFSYNNYGELDKVIYPTGAYQRYQYAAVPALGNPLVPYPQMSRGITSRWLNAKGSASLADEVQWLYEFNGGYTSVTAPGPTGAADGIKTVTYLYNLASPQNNFGYDSALNGMAYEERVYAPGVNGPMIRRTLTDWEVSSATYNRPPQGTGTYTATRNARPTKTVSLILETEGAALTSASTSVYDTTYQFSVGLDQTSTTEYAYTTVDQTTAQSGAISAMPLGSPVRTSQTTFLTSNANYRDVNILGLVSSSVVRAGGPTGTIVSQASFGYDESAYPLLPPYSLVTGWTNPSSSYRGNVTTTGRWLDYPTSTWIYSHARYDQCGSVRIAWDARDTWLTNPSQVDYSDAFTDGAHNTYAFPTTTTSSVPDPSGTYGQTTSLVSTTVHDFNTGLVTSATDANGRTTSFEYNDPSNRLKKTTRPDGGWTAINYSDVPGNTYVRTQTLQQSTPSQVVLESYEYFDKLGRRVRSFVAEGATYLAGATEYDKIGRVLKVSNPFRTTLLGESVTPSGLAWTTNTYDTLNRLKTVTAADGSQARTDYGYSLVSGNLGTMVTAIDPTLRSRRSITDASGRTIRTIEDPNGYPSHPLLAHETNYTYDALNNLRKVEQGSELRYFGYDSLSRLIRTRAVEQTVNSALNWSDPVTGYNGGWTMGMSYDSNGNVVSRTDARNVTTTYGYDALNRNTTVRYTDGTKDIDRHYDGALNGKGRLWFLNWDEGHNTRFDSHTVIDEYDVVGRPRNYRQHFFTNGVASPQFNVKYTYNLGGQVTSETYPSGHTVGFVYDGAGRISSYSGNLGDGTSRTYASAITYSESGSLQQEQFGTQTALFHKLHYNVRGQLNDIRLSNTAWALDEWNWNRGAIINYFATADLSCQTNECRANSGPDNNGNIRQSQYWIPTNDQMNGYNWTEDRYLYDSLNRLESVAEYHGSHTNGLSDQDFKQAYSYDRYGNRTIDQGQTTTNVPHPNYTTDTNSNSNRLIAPIGYSYSYDAAGNQTNDNYTGAGARTYDGENRLKTAQGYPNSQWQTYTYDAGGRRIKRNVNGVETWQVYGIGGELLAEYKAGAAPFLPSKEYGYRGNELLVTMSSGDDARLARFVTNLYYGAKQADPTAQQLQDAVNQLAAAGATSQAQLLTVAKQIARALFTGTNYETNAPARTDAQYVGDLYYAYLQRGPDDSGLGWWTGQVAVNGRTNVCNAFEGSAEFITLVSTLYGTSTSDNERTEHFVTNFYLGARGTNASPTELQTQRDALNAAAAQGLSLVQAQAESFGRSLFITQVSDAGVSNSQFVTNLYEAFLQRGPDAGGLSFWSGQATVGTGRQNVLSQFATCGSFRELAGTLYREAFWLVSDRLGTPRMIVDKSGTLASVKRHDYLPFGEELAAGMSGRTTSQGYTGDSMRQHFTGYEADGETGLNFAEARYQSNPQGRFTSVDPLAASASVGDPQTLNRYSYANNNPTNLTDPSGMAPYGADRGWADVAGGFWPTGFDLNASHFGGPAILYAAEYLQNIAVGAGIQERRNYPMGHHYKKTGFWLGSALNRLVDQAAGFDFTGGANISVLGFITGINPGQNSQQAGGGTFFTAIGPPVIEADPSGKEVALREWIKQHPNGLGEGWCAEFVQILAEAQGTPLGLAGGARWRAGEGVSGATDIRRGTVIISGINADGFYPNYGDYGNHAGIYLRPLANGGFTILEQIHGIIQIREVTDLKSSSYFLNPKGYYVLQVTAGRPGVPDKLYH
ncbi:MAG TPA: BPSL0067 family protein [Pyrinomonadaceae bacterium]|jgi:RHS repeat-associated protein|nr:BPSL0067 family protein [Pyrinomonadaceae bacterium]